MQSYISNIFVLSSMFFIGAIVLHLFDCEKCVKSCVSFTDEGVKQCVTNCKCIDNRFNNWLNWYHLDDYSYMKEDDLMCKNNYDTTEILKQTKSTSKPNIIIFVMDDGSNYVDPMFEAMPFAKELFQLNGTEFSNAFTSTSFCCPARCQIFTGMYGHSNGVISSEGSYSSMKAFLMPLFLNESRQTNPSNGKCINNLYRSVNMYLKQLNYTNGMLGKFINGHESSNPRFHSVKFIPPGWDTFDMCVNNYMYIGNMYVMSEWNVTTNKVNYKWYGKEPSDYLTDVLSKKSQNFIENYGGKSPFFLYIASTAPHGPMISAERHRDKMAYWDSQFEKWIKNRPNYHNDMSTNTKSSWIKNISDRSELLGLTPLYYKKNKLNVHKLEFRRRMGSYYALDEMIKNTYQTVKQRGELANTIFLLTSDNGLNEGAHGFSHKMTAYEESVRVPMFASGFAFEKSKVDERLVLLNDIAPTILDLIGLKIPKHMDGISLINQQSARKSILFEYGKRKANEKFSGSLKDVSEFKMIADIAPDAFAHDVYPYIGIRTKNYTLIEYYYDNKFEYELYDIINDQYQITNLVYNNTYHPEFKTLLSRLHKLSKCEGFDCNYI